MKDYIKIAILKYPKLEKCNMCDRVKDIFYRADIFDYKNAEYIIGDLTLCKQCGDNLNKILGNENNLGEKIIKEFKF